MVSQSEESVGEVKIKNGYYLYTIDQQYFFVWSGAFDNSDLLLSINFCNITSTSHNHYTNKQ